MRSGCCFRMESIPLLCALGQVVRSKREQLAYTEHDSVDLVIITAESTLIEQQVEWDEVRAAVWGGLLVVFLWYRSQL